MSEVLFSHGNITVTESVVKVGSATYPIANIGSVVSGKDPKSNAGALIFFGILGGLIFGVAVHWVLGLVIFLLLIFCAMRLPDRHMLTLKTSSGDVNALITEDQRLVNDVKSAIESAFSGGSSHGKR